jgi:hypothetical protein
MSLFTINFQFGGTTAVAQVNADNPQQAATKWIGGLNAATMKNVWCVSAPLNGLLALVYLTETATLEAARKLAPKLRAKAAEARK